MKITSGRIAEDCEHKSVVFDVFLNRSGVVHLWVDHGMEHLAFNIYSRSTNFADEVYHFVHDFVHVFLFADDTNLLYADKNLKSLEKVVNKELEHVSDWLIANKLTLNIKKSNYVLFHSHKKKLDYTPNLKVFDHKSGTRISLVSKTFIKYLGILLDSNLSWKAHIDYISLAKQSA